MKKLLLIFILFSCCKDQIQPVIDISGLWETGFIQYGNTHLIELELTQTGNILDSPDGKYTVIILDKTDVYTMAFISGEIKEDSVFLKYDFYPGITLNIDGLIVSDKIIICTLYYEYINDDRYLVYENLILKNDD